MLQDEVFLLNPNITVDMDQRCLRSLNGYRATCEILNEVPKPAIFLLSEYQNTDVTSAKTRLRTTT